MSFTKSEIEVMSAMIDEGADFGSVANATGKTLRQVKGVVNSLIKKGVVDSDGLTEFGKQTLKEIGSQT
ncbi:MAG: hypothetical protein QXM15_04740, partial [Archaeoglobaceae archaeon]